MTTLVLHAGAENADGGAVHLQLSAWREQLAGLGVWLPPGHSVTDWRETGMGLLHGESAGAAAARGWLAEAQAAGARAALISSDALSDALTSPAEVAGLAALAQELGIDVRVVVVVREQVGYINSLYCKRVLAMETARSFTEFATTSVPAHRFDYVASFGAVADTEGVDLVAVTYPRLVSAGAGRVVLEAAGLDDCAAALPVDTVSPAPLPGPVLIGATRLLHKRLRRMGMFHEHGKARLRNLVERLAQQAVAGGWETTTYWGWDVPLRRAVEEEYTASNEMFAEFVWGSPWEEPYSTGKPQRSDLADLEPPILHDVLKSVDGLVDGLSKGTLDLG